MISAAASRIAAMLLPCAALLLPACKDAPSAPPAPAQSASAPSASARAPEALRPAKPKATKDTAAADLGTLPEGVGIPVGQKAPDFEVKDPAGKAVTLDSLLAKSPYVLLVFYRGGW